MPYEVLWNDINNADAANGWYTYPTPEDLVGFTYSVYGQAWQYLFPLIAETVLFGSYTTTTYQTSDFNND